MLTLVDVQLGLYALVTMCRSAAAMADRRRLLRPAVAASALAGALLALAIGAGVGPALAQGAGTATTATPGPAGGTAGSVGDRVVGLKRVQVGLTRRVVPFDGQVRLYQNQAAKVTVSLDTQVLFDFDQATLTPAAQASLRTLADELNRNLAAPAVSVDGHTDAVGPDAHNLDLSSRRAMAVRDFLAPLIRVPVTFTVVGQGSAQPVAPNTKPDGTDDPGGRRRNRRVELTYTSKAQPTR